MDAPAVAVTHDGDKVKLAWMAEMAPLGRIIQTVEKGRRGAAKRGSFGTADARDRHQSHPAVALTGAGDFCAVWEDQADKPTRIYLATSAGVAVLSAPSEGSATFPVIACSAIHFVVVYQVERDGADRVVSRVTTGVGK